MRSAALVFYLVAGVISSPIAQTKDAKDVCSYEFSSGDAAKDKDLWDKTGAGKFLSDFLKQSGTDNWTDKIFQKTVAGGSQFGTTYDCGDFPASNKCPSPGQTPCTSYTPKEMFYIHNSISNFYGAFDKMHESMQNKAIIDIASTTKAITDAWGPPPKDQGPNIFAIIIGAFVFATPLEWAAMDMAGMIGMTNVIAGFATDAAKDPLVFQGELNDQVGKMFSIYQDAITKTVTGVLAGKNLTDKVEGKSKADWIADRFAQGVMVDKTLVDSITDKWIANAHSLVTDALLLYAFKIMDPPLKVKIRNPEKGKMDAAECKKKPGTIWDDTLGCAGFAVGIKAPMTGTLYEWLDQKDIDKASKFMKDYMGALQTNIDCLKAGTKDLKGYVPTTKPDFNPQSYGIGKVPKYPKCFWNIERLNDPMLPNTQAPPPPDQKTVADAVAVAGAFTSLTLNGVKPPQ